MADEFTGKANVYDKARPGYCSAALDFILATCGGAPRFASAADIGAGTGKLTRPLLERFGLVYAVEPNEDMRSLLPARENLRVLDGTAEATGLPDCSVDIVTCAQAFHWFDGEKFKQECRRILKPSGRVFVLYNGPGPNYRRHDELIWHREGPRDGSGAAWLERETNLRKFFDEKLSRTAFPNPVFYDAQGWMDYMLSHSQSPRPGDEIYARFIESVRLIFERNHENEKLRMDFETVVYTNL